MLNVARIVAYALFTAVLKSVGGGYCVLSVQLAWTYYDSLQICSNN
ncbi:hypothetical protein DSUL_50007 [Desulfovibrionales bacterium]